MEPGAPPDFETSLQRAGCEIHVEHYRAQGETRLAWSWCMAIPRTADSIATWAHAFASAGIAVTQFDCRGHGRSSGRRGHIVDFGEYVDDLAMVVDWARQQDAGSHGPCSATAWAAPSPWPCSGPGQSGKPSRLVLAAPWLKLKMKVSAPNGPRPMWPRGSCQRFTMPNGLTAENVSRNPLVLDGFDKDPLVHHVATAGWFMATLRAQARIRLQAKELKVPTLLLVAGGDRIVANEATSPLPARPDRSSRFALSRALPRDVSRTRSRARLGRHLDLACSAHQTRKRPSRIASARPLAGE
jgi:alpha-beta hydrolase superfamily lysophospholipase